MKKHVKCIRQACFVCTTPYQVIGALSINLAYKLDADLYIFGMFPNYEKIADNLKKYHYFSNVYPVDCKKIGAPGRVKGFIQMLFSARTVSFFLPENIIYQYYFSSSRALIKTIMQNVLLKRNPQMKKVIFEDGMGTYNKNSHPFQATKVKHFAEKILGWNLDIPGSTYMMAYVPELVELPNTLQDCRIVEMPRLEFSNENVENLEAIFSISADSRISNKYIIFDTLRAPAFHWDENKNTLLDRCYEMVVEYAGENQVICKPHPRSTVSSNAKVKIYTDQEIPMEILYASMDNLNERILVTYTSTAVFTPKILFDEEPVVICLHNLFPEISESKIFQEIYVKFKGIYRNQNKVVAPSSLEELKKILEKIADMSSRKSRKV